MPDESFRNPYLPEEGKPTVPTKTVQTSISVKDYQLVTCTRPGSGTVTGVLGTLWKALCNELESRGINDVSHQSDFEQLVANLKLLTRGEYEELLHDASQWQQHNLSSGGRLLDRPTGGDLPKSGASDDTRGTKRPRAKH